MSKRVLIARIEALADAERALARGEEGAGEARRQSLIDLAAICEAMADELPAGDLSDLGGAFYTGARST